MLLTLPGEDPSDLAEAAVGPGCTTSKTCKAGVGETGQGECNRAFP